MARVRHRLLAHDGCSVLSSISSRSCTYVLLDSDRQHDCWGRIHRVGPSALATCSGTPRRDTSPHADAYPVCGGRAKRNPWGGPLCQDRLRQGGFNWSSQHLDMEVVRWVFGSVSRRSVPCAAKSTRRVGCRWHDATIAKSSGRRSHGASRARTPEWRRVCRRRSGPGGSATLAGCHRSAWPRSRGGICRLLNAKTSPSCMPNRSGCARSLGVWAATPRRSRGSYGVTPRLGRTALSTGPPRPSGMPKGARVAPKCPSWLRTSSCESTSETVFLA